MSKKKDKTFASRFFSRYPNIKSIVVKSKEFDSWKNQFPTINIDGVVYYLLGGPVSNGLTSSSNNHPKIKMMNPGADQPQEEDEIILEWARMKGLVSKEELDKFSEDE